VPIFHQFDEMLDQFSLGGVGYGGGLEMVTGEMMARGLGGAVM
jgi:hypothetical protein